MLGGPQQTAGLCLSPSRPHLHSGVPVHAHTDQEDKAALHGNHGFIIHGLSWPVDGRLESARTVLDGACQSMS